MAYVLTGSARQNGIGVGDFTASAINTTDNALMTIGMVQRGSVLITTTLSYAGSSASLLVQADNTVPTNDVRAEIWYLKNVPSGSGILTGCFNAAITYECQLAFWSGVDQASPLGVTASAIAQNASPRVDVTTRENNELVLATYVHEYQSPLSTGSSASALFNFDNGAFVTGTSYAVKATAGSIAMFWEGAASDYWAAAVATFEEGVANESPTASPNTADLSVFGPLPVLEFTGSDPDDDDLTYQIQISTRNDFQSGSPLADYNNSGLGAALHPNPTSTINWLGNRGVDDRFGQSFKGKGGILKRAGVYFTPDILADGYALVRIYGHQGTFGTDGEPLNAASPADTPTPGWYAVSPSTYINTSSASGWHYFDFDEDNQIRLESDTPYFVIADWIPSSSSYDNTIVMTGDATEKDHHGNAYIDGESVANNGVRSDFDLLFEIYEEGSLIDKVSSSDSGFENTVSGSSDTDPFASGEKIKYTVSASLDSGTYFWRVRTRDPGGLGIWSDWTTTRSFEVSGVRDAHHLISSDHLTLSIQVQLSISDASHSVSSDNVVLEIESPASNLVVSDATHAHTTDSLTLAVTSHLVVSDSLHAHTADTIALSQNHILATTDAVHSHTSESITLSQIHSLSIADTIHSHAADNVVLSFIGTDNLTIADAVHGHASDALLLSQTHRIIVADSAHAHATDNIALTQTGFVAVADANHNHIADSLTLTQTHVLSTGDSTHAHAADNVILQTEGTNNLDINDARHAHSADAVNLTQIHSVSVSESIHNHVADAIQLSTITSISILDATHSHTADAVSLSQIHSLSPLDTIHAHLADNVTLQFHGVDILSISDAAHAHLSESLSLYQINALSISESFHQIASETITLAELALTLATSDSIHAHTSETVSFTQIHIIVTQDANHMILSDNITIPVSLTIANVYVSDFAENFARVADGVVTQLLLEEL